MATKLNILFSFILIMLLILCQESQGKHSPTPAAQAPAVSPSPSTRPSHNTPTHGVTEGSLQPQECPGRCAARCSGTQYHKPCMFFCQKCCATCLCVPPGTYGNKQFCPCYNNWKTKRGGPKCP